MNQRLRVVVVDDHAMFRTGVKAELREAVDIVGEAANVDEAVAVVFGAAARCRAPRRAPAGWRRD